LLRYLGLTQFSSSCCSLVSHPCVYVPGGGGLSKGYVPMGDMTLGMRPPRGGRFGVGAVVRLEEDAGESGRLRRRVSLAEVGVFFALGEGGSGRSTRGAAGGLRGAVMDLRFGFAAGRKGPSTGVGRAGEAEGAAGTLR
jgi:hypothetical protein